MNWKNIFIRVLLFVVVVFVTQSVFIAFIPRMVFGIAKHRFEQPLNTIIHAPRTDAKLRRVVLPNPDFIYSACFFDVTQHDIILKGDFPDSSQYCSISFYDNEVQPFHVVNNCSGDKNFEIRLSSKNASGKTISKTLQGAALLRILVTDSAQISEALRIQKLFSVAEIQKNNRQ